MKKGNPFKKENVMDTAIKVGIGGAANVALDYIINSVDAIKDVDSKIINGVKFVAGTVGSAMLSDKMAKAALDGVAVVGVSNLVSSLMSDDTTEEKTSGVPAGTVGRIRVVPGHTQYAKAVKKSVSGTANFVD